MGKNLKRIVMLVVFFSLLAVVAATCEQNAQARLNSTWKVGTQLEYELPSNDPKFINKTTFQIVGLNATTGAINTSRDGRFKESFPFILTEENVTAFLGDTTFNGTPGFGSSVYGEKQVVWLNKSGDWVATFVNTTSFLKYKYNATTYYVVIDVASGVVLELGDATTGNVLLKLTRWPDSFLDWDLIFTIIATIAALFLFVGMYRFATRELRIAPQDTKTDRARIHLSSFMLAIVMTGVVIFIATIIMTTIGENWKLALDIGVKNPQTGNYEALSANWQVEIGFIRAFQWPTFIPITLVLIGIYIIIYPFFEMFFIAKRGSDAPTEISQKIENNVIDRMPPPLNYLMAIILLFLLYLLPTYLIYQWFVTYNPGAESSIRLVLYMLQSGIAWSTIPALIFLNYYASFGIVTTFQTSIGKGFKSKQRKDNYKNLVIFLIVLILIFTIVYNFYVSVRGLITASITRDNTDMLPSIVLQDPSRGMQFLTRGIRYFIQINPFDPEKALSLKKFDQFVTVFPLDLIIFLLTVCVVGLYGFYSKFLSKEPLNRPILVLFASYIIAAIGVNVFINVILRLPNAFPPDTLAGRLLVEPFTNPNNYPDYSPQFMTDYWNHYLNIRILFFIPYFANHVIMFAMLLYGMFWNKGLKFNIKESVLHFAIQHDRMDILSKYTGSEKESTQLVVIENIYRIVKSTPIIPPQSIPALEKMIASPIPEVSRLANKTLRSLSKKHDIEQVESVYLKALKSDVEIVRQGIAQSIVKVGRADPNKIVHLYNRIITADLPLVSHETIIMTLEDLNTTNPEILVNVVLPMLDSESASIRKGVLKIAKSQIFRLQEKSGEIVPKLLKITHQKDEEEVGDALEILGIVGAFNKTLADEILSRLEELKPTASVVVKQKIINATLSMMVAMPERINEFFPKVMVFLDDPLPAIRTEVGAVLRGVGVALAENQIFNQIENILFKILGDKIEEVRAEGAQAVAVIGKANINLLQEDPEFIQMVEMIVKDPAQSVREKIMEMFVYYSKTAPTMVIYYLLLKLLAENLPMVSNRVIFEILSNTVELFPKEENIEFLLNPILTADRSDDEIRHEITELLGVISKTRPETLKRVYPVLLNLVNDKNDRISKDAIRAIGDIALQKMKNPQLPLEESLDNLIDILLNQCQGHQGKAQIAAVEYITTIFDSKPEIYVKVYPVFLKLKDVTEPEILKRLILVLTNIVCNNKQEYGPRKDEHAAATIWVPATKFNEEFLPALGHMMKVNDLDVREAFSMAINIIVDTFPEASKEVGDFLKTVLSPNQPEQTQMMAIAVLGRFSGVLEDPDLIKALMKASANKKNAEIQAKALSAICNIISRSPELRALDSSRKRRLKKFIQSMFHAHFINDKRHEVRREYIGTLVMIGKKQPDFEKTFSFLRQMVLDEDEQNSVNAIRGFFNILKTYPEKIPWYAHYFRNFGRSRHVATRKILNEEIRVILYKTGKMEQVLPTILLQASDENQDVRRSAFEDFKTVIERFPTDAFYFRTMLLKLLRDKNHAIREDTIPLAVTFLVKSPQYVTSGDPLFRAYLDLSRNPLESTRLQTVTYLEEIIGIVKEDQINLIFQSLFRFIREVNRKIKDYTVGCFQAVVRRFPERIPDILSDLVKINRREQNVLLELLINQLKEKIGKGKKSAKE